MMHRWLVDRYSNLYKLSRFRDMTNIWGISATRGTNVWVRTRNMDNPSHLFSSWPLPCFFSRSDMLSMILALSKPKVAALC